MLYILAFLLSLVPSVLIYIWLRNRHRDDVLYKKSCGSALKRGIFCVLPILVLSGVLSVLSGALKAALLKDANILVYKAIYTFVVLALAEEIVKYAAFRLLLKKRSRPYSWADVAAVMVIIGTGFGLIEDVPYAIDASPGIMLVRGLTMGHVAYGFIMGWFYGKRLYTGKKRYGWIAVLLPWLLHGIYDFSLVPELIEFNDNLVVIAVTMALLEVVVLILMIRFFIRSRRKERYQQPVISVIRTENESGT